MSEIRIDKVDVPKATFTPEGFLRCDSIVTRAGVFEYREPNGTIRRELRHPDDVFNEDSLNSIKSIPVTDNHPTVLVNADNAGDLMVGMTGETVKIDGDNVISSVSVTHKDALKKIKNGKKGWSLGYTVTVLDEAGYYNGESYTHRQTNIKYNHLALVDHGRAGKDARINLDALVQCDSTTIIKKDKSMQDEDVKNLTSRVNLLEKELHTAEKLRSDSVSSLEKVQAEKEQLQKEVEELKAQRVDSLINEKAKERVGLVVKAHKILGEKVNLDDLDSRQIMELAIKSKNKEVNLDERTDEYIAGKFDTLIESLTDSSAIQKQMKHLDTVAHVQTNSLDVLNSHFNSHIKKVGI